MISVPKLKTMNQSMNQTYTSILISGFMGMKLYLDKLNSKPDKYALLLGYTNHCFSQLVFESKSQRISPNLVTRSYGLRPAPKNNFSVHVKSSPSENSKIMSMAAIHGLLVLLLNFTQCPHAISELTQ